jgi:hypothetical protein
VSDSRADATVYGIAAWTAEELSVRVLKGGTTVGQLAQGAVVRARYAALHVPAALLL